ncbi:hypothetical protein [Shewanella fidelis]|uniref:hypothetical protein n=1 Tax=Shewanella fidelis TaxID=173509 RepID=UPI001FE1F625|nr:hypothetical protein [Shewanella fidelis]
MAELSIIALVAGVLALCYLSVYPKLAGSNFNRLSMCDIVVTIIVFCLVGSKYWGADFQFDLLLFHTNWFWFTLVVYAFFEIPLGLWYFKKHGVKI